MQVNGTTQAAFKAAERAGSCLYKCVVFEWSWRLGKYPASWTKPNVVPVSRKG